MGGGVFPIYYNITWGRGGSLGTPNLYYVIYGRPLICLTADEMRHVKRMKGKTIFENGRKKSRKVVGEGKYFVSGGEGERRKKGRKIF